MNKIVKWIILCILISAIIVLSIYNIKNNIDGLGKTLFWRATIADVVNIVLTIIIAIVIVSIQSKSENKKEALKKIIEKFQGTIIISVLQLIDSTPELTNKRILIHTRKINNQISIIEKYSKVSSSKIDMVYIKQKVNAYTDLLSDNAFKLETIELEAEKLIENIDNKCEETKLGLY